ncbi:hypothetical protein D5R81_10475 [Parashewanella spongiae]|uniref:SnoaL-like domain-containing protein n=1 Tax=Parashewanella spongiae TaxID=342950 RepID=A0A3A6TT31_9GAMM|nr:nuclear transport factor 2 family protein [Parashewanella spongiae]MCL1077891.1 nuclear transport factor 2 family protein [Parashewanella spongiae]RJY14937.1 hypothetical protein D5R81_10475 [Parashewanella spongiae]
MSNASDAEKKLLSLANDFIVHHAQKKTENMLALFARDGEIHFWGTGIDEEGSDINDLRSQFERDFNEVSKVEISPTDTKVFATEKSGVVIGNWNICYQLNGSHETEILALRTTIYADVTSGSWRIRHAHWSVAYGAQPTGRSFSSKQELNIQLEQE